MQNHPSKSHSILAAIIDFYFIFFSLCALTALIMPPVKEFLSHSDKLLKFIFFFGGLLKFIFFLLALISTTIYHWFLKNKINFLSFGERAVGKITQGGKKIWHNPYSVSRAFMFLVMVMGLILITPLWSKLWIGLSLDYNQVFSRLMIMFFTFYPMLALGKGKIWPILLSSILFIFILVIKFYLNAPVHPLRMTTGLVIVSLIYLAISLGYFGIFLYYRKKIKNT